MCIDVSYKFSFHIFVGVWGLNPGPCIYYVLSLSIELSQVSIS